MKASDNKEMHAYALLMYTMIYHNMVHARRDLSGAMPSLRRLQDRYFHSTSLRSIFHSTTVYEADDESVH